MLLLQGNLLATGQSFRDHHFQSQGISHRYLYCFIFSIFPSYQYIIPGLRLYDGDGEVKVNGETEVRRGRKLYPDDIFEYDGNAIKVVKKDDP